MLKKTLFKNCKVIDVINQTISEQNVVVKGNKIIFVGLNYNKHIDEVIDVKGKWLCPSFIDGHIHIESTMLSPFNFATTVVKHGTCAIVEDPHEIVNVAGLEGMDYILNSTKHLPIDVFVMFPSCVPATQFDEPKQEILSDMMTPYLKKDRVLGLGELMNFYEAINGDKKVIDKINLAKKMNKIIDGHAPGLIGDDLKKYVSLGINSDHECTTVEEAIQRIKLGMWLMIREGSAARNLKTLLPLIDSHPDKCLFVTDDLNAADLLSQGHIDRIIRKAIESGKDPIKCITLATINAAKCFNLKNYGAIKEGYFANFIILDDLNKIKINKVYKSGELVYDKNKTIKFKEDEINLKKYSYIFNSMKAKAFKLKDLYVKAKGIHKTRVIEVVPGQLITNEKIISLNFNKNNGIDVANDILKIAVVERHNKTGHIALGYVKGFGLKSGAIASTVSHDSHNIIAIGCSEKEIMKAIKKIIEIGGGNVIVNGGKIIHYVQLKVAGLMSSMPAKHTANKIQEIKKKLYSLGVDKELEPFMNMAFISLPVIPNIKITTIGLVDVKTNQIVNLLVD